MRVRFTWILLSCAFAFTFTSVQAASDCPSGLTAFKKSVYPKIMRDCALCHDGSGGGPGFAISPSDESYQLLRNHVSFPDALKSVLVVRAGNGHCGRANCNSDSGREMALLTQQWWDEGEQACSHAGRFLTAEIDLPPTLAVGAFTTLQWPLDIISQQLSASSFVVEAQRFALSGEKNPGAYRFRRPRIIGGHTGLRVKDIKILVNRKFDPITNAFTFIDRIVSPLAHYAIPWFPILTADTLIVLQDQPKGDRISVSFEGLAPALGESCHALNQFISEVQPVLAEGRCLTCHALDATHPDKGMAGTAFPMDVPVADLCRGMRERIALSTPEYLTSPAVVMPVEGKFDHKKVFEDPTDYLAALRTWVTEETTRSTALHRKQIAR